MNKQRVYKIHPVAEIFPRMSDAELRELADDIRANGLMEPIALYQGNILDGRNRASACKMAEVVPKFKELNGQVSSPTSFVLSANLHRRHLTVGQRGTIAAAAVPLLQEESKKRQKASLKQNQPLSPLTPIGVNGELKGSSVKIAASMIGVGEGTVQRVLAVKRKDPALFEKIKRGEITANAAHRRSCQPLALEGTVIQDRPKTKSDVPGVAKVILKLEVMLRGFPADYKKAFLAELRRKVEAWLKNLERDGGHGETLQAG